MSAKSKRARAKASAPAQPPAQPTPKECIESLRRCLRRWKYAYDLTIEHEGIQWLIVLIYSAVARAQLGDENAVRELRAAHEFITAGHREALAWRDVVGRLAPRHGNVIDMAAWRSKQGGAS